VAEFSARYWQSPETMNAYRSSPRLETAAKRTRREVRRVALLF